jgi:hypothetical protein
MSKLKAVLLTAIIGSSSAAMAQPTVTFSGGASAQFSWGTPASYTAPVVRDHSSNQTAYQMPSSRETYINLASSLNLATGRDVVRPQMSLRNTDSLMLRVNSGMAFVQKVRVQFADGSMQNVPVNAWMSTRNAAPLEIGLRNNKRIDTITIIGSASGRVSYQLFAQANQSIELPHAPPPVYQPQSALSGVYQSNYGDVVITQSGNRIHGTYVAFNGTIDGTIEGNVIHFRWSQPVGGSGYGTWYIGNDGHLSGTFGQDMSDTSWGAWNLTLRSR